MTQPNTGSVAGLIVMSERTYTKGPFPGPLLSVSPSPLPAHTNTADPPTLAGRSGSVSCGVIALSHWVLAYTGFCFCSRVESLFPPVLWSPVIKSHWPSKSDSLGTPSPFVGSPSWEAWRGTQKLRNSGRTSLLLVFSSLWAAHLVGMEFDFIVIVPLLPSHCGFLSLDMEDLFLVGSRICRSGSNS